MVSDIPEMPFFPKYETEYAEESRVRVDWFQWNFSQSHYNSSEGKSGSNACTLIATLVAAKCHKQHLQLSNVLDEDPSVRLIKILGTSMLEGNQIYDDLKANNMLKHVNLNVPEAIKFAAHRAQGLTEWKGLIFLDNLSDSLYHNIRKEFVQWSKLNLKLPNKDLYIMLVADSRTVLFFLQHSTGMAILVDSHQHSPSRGAVIALCRRRYLKCLCDWFASQVLWNCYDSDPTIYELSFLYFKN